MGSRTYVKNAVKVVESLIAEDDPEAKLKSAAHNLFPTGNKPKLDVTPELNESLDRDSSNWSESFDGQSSLGVWTSTLSSHSCPNIKRYHVEDTLKRLTLHSLVILRNAKMEPELFSTRRRLKSINAW
jgi:hypothetical protein